MQTCARRRSEGADPVAEAIGPDLLIDLCLEEGPGMAFEE